MSSKKVDKYIVKNNNDKYFHLTAGNEDFVERDEDGIAIFVGGWEQWAKDMKEFLSIVEKLNKFKEYIIKNNLHVI